MAKNDGKVKILIAEDEKALARALQLKLSASGFDVDIAENGEEAIKKIQAGGISLMLLDLVMPKKDGFAVLEELQKNKIKVPVIVASNLSQTEDVEKAKGLGAKDYFVKSDTPLSGIVDRVKKFLE